MERAVLNAMSTRSDNRNANVIFDVSGREAFPTIELFWNGRKTVDQVARLGFPELGIPDREHRLSTHRSIAVPRPYRAGFGWKDAESTQSVPELTSQCHPYSMFSTSIGKTREPLSCPWSALKPWLA
jgi:hypothetical protein